MKKKRNLTRRTVTESPEDIVSQLMELEDQAMLALADYMESREGASNVISIAPGSPARRMWETRLTLIEFLWKHGMVETDE